MKELSIEEKAKAYDEALKIAKEAYETYNIEGQRRLLKEMFQELAERKVKETNNIEIPFGAFDSELEGFEYIIPEGFGAEIKDGKVVVHKAEREDEKIRRCICEVLLDTPAQLLVEKNLDLSQALSWLEKQGEQKPEMTPKFKVGDTIWKKSDHSNKITISSIDEYFYYANSYNIIIDIADNDWELVEQKPVEEYSFNIESELFHQLTQAQQGLWRKEIEQAYNAGADTQKPAWSEEDNQIALSIEQVVNCASLLNIVPEKMDKISTWLKSLKDRYIPQPKLKQEWSEEDETVLNNLIYALANDRMGNNRDEYVAWLKSLRPQNTWKPSDEQIIDLEKAIDDFIPSSYKEIRVSLEKLLKQLKAL